jgi:CheY-like chemotaxis protein
MSTLQNIGLPSGGGSATPASGKGEMTAQDTKRRILLIEDEMLIAMLLEDMLVDLGHQVVGSITRVNEALAAVTREDFDLVILDLHLNGQSAYPVADALIDRGMPFAFATGYGESGLPEKYRGRPILQKPFAREDLELTLKAFQ